MKLNKDSWHALMYISSYRKLPEDGCLYMRRLMWLCIKDLMIILFILVGCLLGLLIVYSTIAIFFIKQNSNNNWIVGLALSGYIIYFSLLIGVGVGKLADWQWDREMRKIKNGIFIREPKKYLLVEYYKAIKNKYCPKIEWIKKE